jgi:hypothetical protein
MDGLYIRFQCSLHFCLVRAIKIVNPGPCQGCQAILTALTVLVCVKELVTD